MGQVSREAHCGNGIEQLHCREQVVCNAVAVGLELDGHALLFRDLEPALDHGNHLGKLDGHFLADDDYIGCLYLVGETQCRSQAFDGLWKGGQAPEQSRAGEVRNGGLRLGQRKCTQIDGHAVEARFPNSIEFLRS
jgi:hypothetical protein